jgi:hypothetical protein
MSAKRTRKQRPAKKTKTRSTENLASKHSEEPTDPQPIASVKFKLVKRNAEYILDSASGMCGDERRFIAPVRLPELVDKVADLYTAFLGEQLRRPITGAQVQQLACLNALAHTDASPTDPTPWTSLAAEAAMGAEVAVQGFVECVTDE